MAIIHALGIPLYNSAHFIAWRCLGNARW